MSKDLKIGPYEVLHSAAGYYVGRECIEGPYDRRSVYFNTRIEGEQELCSYSGHSGENGICTKCDKIYNIQLFCNFLKGRSKLIGKKLLKRIHTKTDWLLIAEFFEIDAKSKKIILEAIIKDILE